jgi:hypothetical protein
MSDAAVASPEVAETPSTPETTLGQTTLEHDGRVFTGSGTDDEATAEAFAETTVGRKVETESAKSGEPKLTRGQRRFSQLTSERDKARSEADALKAELAALKSKPVESAKQEPKAEPVKESKPVDAAKAPELEDFLDQPDPIKAFNKALREHLKNEIDSTIDARLSQRLESERASRELTQTVADLRERGAAAYADFETVLSQSSVAFPEPILAAIVNDPNAEHIYYALSSDDALAKEVAAIRDPLQLGRVLGRLGTAATRAVPASPVSSASSKAPRPFQPVSGASRTASPSAEQLAESGDYERYKAKRHADMGLKVR